jgi:uncharacterized protein YidB (DUF937 family)
MGLLDSIIKQVSDSEGVKGGEAEGMVKGVMSLLGDNTSGGLEGLTKQLSDKGLGDVVNSWISTGKNLPISPQQLQDSLGADRIKQLASSTGLSLQDVGARLSTILPQVVDKLTPDGVIPKGNLLDQGVDFLKKQL